MGHLLTTTQLMFNRWALNAATTTATRLSWPIGTATTATWIEAGHIAGKIHCRSISSTQTILATKSNQQQQQQQSMISPVRRLCTGVACMNNNEHANNDEINGTAVKSQLKTIKLSSPHRYVAHIELNRPKVKNAFSLESAHELMGVLDDLDDDPAIRCVLLSGSGPDFTSGVDLKSFMTIYGQLQETDDVGRKAKLLRSIIGKFQAPFKRMDLFTKPLLSVQHGLCYGLGMELAACSDVRYCSADTKYSIREVLIGIAADVGSLQKMPSLVSNQSLLRELIYTGRDVGADEARQLGFVSTICETKDKAIREALKTALTIAKRSPVAVQGSKQNLRFSEGKPFDVGLDYNAIWNMAMMQSGDVVKAIEAILSRSDDDADYENF